ncbi:hypothetical protein BASA50_005412 [Batrachochytrium salamandrivorans]|uniref:Uncharacterized protein n=1 Tax=Batrachochytrium salamandrivorans TaxID=1357716 RepID=A0ABQ8FG00_9FUNG|nr:hypothetical protein BASA50_005412 [Batrachochytrium salamandrivorans]
MTAAAAVLVDGEAKICSNGLTREHYFEQFDISRVGDTICKACKDAQSYDGGHLLDTLTSAVDYVERHQGNSIYEQDAAHMGPEVVCQEDPRQMDSSHSDCYRQTVYLTNLNILAASAISDAVDCLKCPTTLLQLCDIALDDGPLLLPAWPLKGVNIEHFPTPIHLISNIPPAPSTDTNDMAISAPAATAKRGSTAARSTKAASIKRGGSLAAPIFNSIIGPEKEDASPLKRKRTRKDGGIPTQRKKACKVDAQPSVEKLASPKERLEAKEEENKDIGSTSVVRQPYRTSKKPANTLATAGDTMPTEDGLKAMAYIVSSLRIVPHSSELFKIYSASLACLPGSSNSSSTMECTNKTKDETVDLLLALNGVGARSLDIYLDAIEGRQFASASQFRVTLLMDLQKIEAALGADGEAGNHLRRTLAKLFKLFGSLWEFYFPLVDDISQGNNSGRRSCNARSDLGLTLVAATPPSLSSLPARLKSKRAATELTNLDTAAPKRLCKS